MAITCDVCSGELIIGSGGKTARCSVCGIAYSIERIREKVKAAHEKSSEKYMIFSATHMNWGQISKTEGTWLRTEYKVYDDGTLWSKAEFCYDNPHSLWAKLSQPSEDKLSQELFAELREILNKEFNYAKTVNACDGDGWEMISFEQDGSVFHKLSGHIYGVSVLERIEKILQNKSDYIPSDNTQNDCVDFEIVDFEVIEEETERTLPPVRKPKDIFRDKEKEEVSLDEDFAFRTEFNEEFHDYDEILVEYVGQATTIIIPEKTTILGEIEGKKSIFRYPENVKKVIVGKYVHIIGDYAFQGCKNLEEIHIPENVGYLWYSCGEEVTTEDDIEMNDCSHIFEGCTGLKKVVFDKNAWQGEDICDTLFKGCSSLKHVELPETMQWIGRYMFEDCVELEEIVIPDSVATIGQYAFKNCRKLKRVVLPNHPLAIHPTAFAGAAYKPPLQYTTGFNVNKCVVCGGKLNWSSQCKKCGRQIIYSGEKKDWK